MVYFYGHLSQFLLCQDKYLTGFQADYKIVAAGILVWLIRYVHSQLLLFWGAVSASERLQVFEVLVFIYSYIYRLWKA